MVAMSSSPAIDEAAVLVARCQDGDRAAFRTLFEKYAGRVHATVYPLVSRKDEVEDVVQKVFLEVHRSVARFEGRSLFTTWLTRVAIHVARAHERKWWIFERSRRSSREAAGGLQVLEGGQAADPQSVLLEQERAEAARALLAKLPMKKRVVLALAELQDLSAVEIADVLNIPPATVRTRLFYARRDFERLARRDAQASRLFGLEADA
ncbi:MAG: sigma-70 family RNA polymerase sigma factor [Pseudomonadota bacterium]